MSDRCECEAPEDVFNGVCGYCLLPMTGTIHSEAGELIEENKG